MIITRQHSGLITSVGFVAVSIVYLVQIASPLRLVNDGIDYLLQASSAIDGNGFRIHGVHSMHPPGYPALILVLAKAGVANSLAIVALNCLMLGIGCWASYIIIRDCFPFSHEEAQLILLLLLLSFVMVRGITYPLSDICFFGMLAPCLLVLIRAERASGSDRLWRLLLAITLMGVCVQLRTIGIALIPAFIWTVIGGAAGLRSLYPTLRRYRLIILLLLAASTVTLGKALLDSRYMQFNLPIFHKRGVLLSVAANIKDHTAEWGEMTVNAPLSKLPGVLELPVRVVGAFAIFVFATGLWVKCKQLDTLMFFVLGFGCIVFAYPWFDTRLWLPVLPFLMAYVLIGLRHLIPPNLLRTSLFAYCSLFGLLGILALGFSTRLTFAGARFPDLYGDGKLRGTYKVALRGETPKNGEEVDQDALYLLRRFEWRAASK
jgi:hypothetical protein